MSVLVPYVVMIPTLIAGAITLGIMQQVVRAFDRVQSSFQFLVRSWSVVVELISVYKRLRLFESQIDLHSDSSSN
jgi:peptide/bleomycin uptake transporter